MSHALWMLREVGPLNTRSKDSLLKAVLKAPVLPAIFLLFPRTRFPALPSVPFGEELPGRIGHLLPDEREPLKTACLRKQMRHKNDRAVRTCLPHPVRHNRSACFITEIFELELLKRENSYGAKSTHFFLTCVCFCVCLCVFACDFVHAASGFVGAACKSRTASQFILMCHANHEYIYIYVYIYVYIYMCVCHI